MFGFLQDRTASSISFGFTADKSEQTALGVTTRVAEPHNAAAGWADQPWTGGGTLARPCFPGVDPHP